MTEPTPAEQLWNLMRGALAARALGVVAELRVADALASGPRAVEEVAREAGADPDTLCRFLRALASDGVFSEDEPGVFRNTEASELLRGDGWSDFAHLFGGVWHRAIAELDASSGDSVFPSTFGTDFWAWLAEHPEERAAFDRAMEQGKERRIERLAGVDWRGDETVVDVGGGNGSLLRELLGRHPDLRGIVFDLPETVRDESTFGDRCTFVAGDFFDKPGEWVPHKISSISPKAERERLNRSLAHLTYDRAAYESTGKHWDFKPIFSEITAVWTGGRERDEAQWRALLDRAGIVPVRIEDGLIEATCR